MTALVSDNVGQAWSLLLGPLQGSRCCKNRQTQYVCTCLCLLAFVLFVKSSHTPRLSVSGGAGGRAGTAPVLDSGKKDKFGIIVANIRLCVCVCVCVFLE